MRVSSSLCAAVLLLVFAGCALFPMKVGPGKGEHWRALHVLNYNTDEALDRFAAKIPALAEMGLNVLILEVDYHFQFESHPELRMSQCISKEGAKRFAAICRKYRIRLIPQFQCLGHQSWAKETFSLLTVYPELDLTPGAFPGNEGLYCREWDVTNPRVYEIIYPLVDEIIDAFDATALHVGMDEVFLLGSEQSPATKGKDPAKLFAKAVNDMYDHVVRKRKIEMLMWADRFIDGAKYKMGTWEASENGTYPAIDMVPKDIIMCPWHYTLRDSYPSIPVFLEKGFRVLPASWNKADAAKKLISYSLGLKNHKLIGHLFTTWGEGSDNIAAWPPLAEGIGLVKGGR